MIIMLAGKIKAGKTTFAEEIMKLLPTVQRVSFGDMIKERYAVATNTPIIELHDISMKERHRKKVVEFGDYLRQTDRYCIARDLFNAIDIDNMDYVIDDLRAIEELELGVALGAIPFKIHAGPLVRKARGWIPNSAVDEHYLENEMDLSKETYKVFGGDVLYNDTMSLQTLKQEVSQFVALNLRKHL